MDTTSQNGQAATPSLQLYWMPGTCSRMPHVALEEIGVPYEMKIVNKFAMDHLTPEYRKLNPKGRVPTLVVNGRPLSENPAILSYLARLFPEAKLLPSGSIGLESDALSTMCWFSSAVHPNVSRHRFPSLYSAFHGHDCIEGVRMEARQQLELHFSIMEEKIDGREWLYDEWSIIDAYMDWLWLRAAGSGMDPTPYPQVADHARRCEERPSVARAIDFEVEEFARHEAAGKVMPGLPPHHVGRAPTFAS